jgi:hypothetical protein
MQKLISLGAKELMMACINMYVYGKYRYRYDKAKLMAAYIVPSLAAMHQRLFTNPIQQLGMLLGTPMRLLKVVLNSRCEC